MTDGTRAEVRPTAQPDTSVIRIEGEITSGSEKPLMDGFARAVDGGARTIILDFGGLDYMNSGGIGHAFWLMRAHSPADSTRGMFSTSPPPVMCARP